MTTTENHRVESPPLSLGLASVILGAIGLMLFIVPIIGASLCACGMVAGIAGVLIYFARSDVSLRLAVAGVLLSGTALLITAAIFLSPTGYFTPRSVFPDYGSESGVPYVAPPAPARSSATRAQTFNSANGR